MDNLIKALTILSKYKDGDSYPVICKDGKLQIMVFIYEGMGDEDRKEVESLGFYWVPDNSHWEYKC